MLGVLHESTRSTEWLGLRLGVPGHWEIVRHSTSPRKGSLVFADRTRQRLQVTWTACTSRPDVARLLADHRAKQREQDADVVITTPLLPAGWRGMQRPQPDGHTLLRAARFDAASSRLIEVVLDDEEGSDLIHEVLNALVVTGPADAARRFQAFGLDLTVPDGFHLVATEIQPADAALTFSTQQALGAAHRTAREPDKSPTLTVRRRAMADVWFDGDLRRVLKPHAPRVAMQFDEGSALLPSLEGGAGGGCTTPTNLGQCLSVDHPHLITLPSKKGDQSASPPHPLVTATWDVPGPRFHRLLNLHRVAVACAWHCPMENAVYDLVAIAPAKSPPTFDDVKLVCGQGGGHG